MFALTSLTVLALAAFPSALAVPAGGKGPNGGYACTDVGFKGDCWHMPAGECLNLDGNWSHKISAFGADPGRSCRLFSGPGCIAFGSAAYYDIGNPGYADLRDIHWNDVTMSVYCA